MAELDRIGESAEDRERRARFHGDCRGAIEAALQRPVGARARRPAKRDAMWCTLEEHHPVGEEQVDEGHRDRADLLRHRHCLGSQLEQHSHRGPVEQEGHGVRHRGFNGHVLPGLLQRKKHRFVVRLASGLP